MMNDFKTYNREVVEVVKNYITPILGALWAEGISSNYYSILLLLLSLHKDGLIFSDITDSEHLKSKLFDDPHSVENKLYCEYALIIDSFEPILNSLKGDVLKQLSNAISKIDTQVLTENFSDIFDSVLYLITQTQGRYGGEFIRPVEFTHFMIGLADLKPDAKVFNPFAGPASFGTFLEKRQYYYAQEINKEVWAIGTLRLMAHDKLECSNYVCEDSISHWPENTGKFDLIISNLPFGMRIRTTSNHTEPEIRTCEQFLIKNGVNSLNHEGKLIVQLNTSFLYSEMNTDKTLRKYLVEEDLIDTIILLPGGMLQNTSIPFAILVLNKAKYLKDKVKFVDAKNFVEIKGPNSKVLNYLALSNFLNSDNQDEDVIRIFDNSTIQSNNYNLNVTRYFQKDITLAKNETLKKLRDVFVKKNGQRVTLPIRGKFVRVKDLKDDNVDFKLNITEIEDVELHRSGVYLLNESSLMLSTQGRKLKPTYFIYEGTPIYVSKDIISFKIDEEETNSGYLVNELHADYIQEQLDSYRMGVTIPFIRKDDLLEVNIKLLSLKEQEAKINGIYELSQKMKSLQYEINALSHGVSDKLYESVSTIKHSLGKPLLNIGSALSNIENALSKLNIDWEHIRISERYDLTIKDSFNSVYSNLDTIHSILHNNETVLDISKYELEEIDFITLIKGFVNRVKSAERKNVNINLDIHPDIEYHLQNKVFVHANSELLEIGLNAIVENAHMHAFVDDSKKYKLEFRVSLYLSSRIEKEFKEIFSKPDNYIKIEVANNGKPFPKNYTLNKLVRKNSFAGETGNTGQGGFDLNEIIKYHNNGTSTLELINDDITSEFSTIYSFLIPLK